MKNQKAFTNAVKTAVSSPIVTKTSKKDFSVVFEDKCSELWSDVIEKSNIQLLNDEEKVKLSFLLNNVADMVTVDNDYNKAFKLNVYNNIADLIYKTIKIYEKCLFRKFLCVQPLLNSVNYRFLMRLSNLSDASTDIKIHNFLPKKEILNKLKEIKKHIPYKLPEWITTDRDLELYTDEIFLLQPDNDSKKLWLSTSDDVPRAMFSMEKVLVESKTIPVEINDIDNEIETLVDIIDDFYIEKVLNLFTDTEDIPVFDFSSESKDILLSESTKIAISTRRGSGDRKSTRLNSSHTDIPRMPSSA